MKIQCESKFNYKVVTLSGEIDLHNSKKLKQVLVELVSENNHIAVDISSLLYIDSSGIACLVEAFNTAKTKKLKFVIVGANGAPLQVLKLTRLDTVFSLATSLEAADL